MTERDVKDWTDAELMRALSAFPRGPRREVLAEAARRLSGQEYDWPVEPMRPLPRWPFRCECGEHFWTFSQIDDAECPVCGSDQLEFEPEPMRLVDGEIRKGWDT